MDELSAFLPAEGPLSLSLTENLPALGADAVEAFHPVDLVPEEQKHSLPFTSFDDQEVCIPQLFNSATSCQNSWLGSSRDGLTGTPFLNASMSSLGVFSLPDDQDMSDFDEVVPFLPL